MCEFYSHIEIILYILKTKTLPKILPFLLFLVIGPVVTKKKLQIWFTNQKAAKHNVTSALNST